MANFKSIEIQVGLFLAIGLCLLGGLIIQFGRFRENLGGNYPLTLVFEDASGLIKGSEVRMGGARIGRVSESPELNEEIQPEVKLAISKRIKIPEGASFQIASATLLGDKLITIVAPEKKTGKFIQPNSTIHGLGPTGLESLQNSAEALGRDARAAIKKAEESLAKVDDAVGDIRVAAKGFGLAMNKLNQSVLAQKNLDHFDQAMSDFAQVGEKWRIASEKIDPAIGEARQTLGTIRAAMNGVPGAVSNISRAAKKGGDILTRVEKGEGFFGAMARDNEISTDAKAFFRNLRRYGIWRYKDSAEPQPAEQKKPSRPFRAYRR